MANKKVSVSKKVVSKTVSVKKSGFDGLVFRPTISFNRHDSKIKQDDNRIVVSLGMKQRCQLVMQSLLRHGKKGATSVDIFKDLSRFKGYVPTDIRGALRRLIKEGFLLVKSEDGELLRYYATRYALSMLK